MEVFGLSSGDGSFRFVCLVMEVFGLSSGDGSFRFVCLVMEEKNVANALVPLLG
jgi:hypothetical protein